MTELKRGDYAKGTGNHSMHGIVQVRQIYTDPSGDTRYIIHNADPLQEDFGLWHVWRNDLIRFNNRDQKKIKAWHEGRAKEKTRIFSTEKIRPPRPTESDYVRIIPARKGYRSRPRKLKSHRAIIHNMGIKFPDIKVKI